MEEYKNKIIEMLNEKKIKVTDAAGLSIDAVELNSAIYIIMSVIGYKD